MTTATGTNTQLKIVPSSDFYRPDIDLPGLFEAVQLQSIYPDQKWFVDATPKHKPSEILARYSAEKDQTQFNLKAFVEREFDFPAPALIPAPIPAPAVASSNVPNMLEHLKSHWNALLRHAERNGNYATLIPLPHPYIVPGGRFREMFYWDSYFTMVGLLQSGQDKLALDMIANFAFLIDQQGYIPNGNRTYFLGRSQPPFFAAMLQLYVKKHGMDSVIHYLPQLEKEYAFWMDGVGPIENHAKTGNHLIVMEDGSYFNRYYGGRDAPRAEAFNKETRWAETKSPEEKKIFYRNLRAACESGWDFSSRWFADGKEKSSINTMDIIPVDLSSLLYSLEKTLADLHRYRHDLTRADFYLSRAEKRKAMIQQVHYDAASGSYQDYNFVTRKRTGNLSVAMMFPLFFEIASPQEAQRVAGTIKDKFLMPGGVVTTLTKTGEQWDYPNGWAPMQYIAVQGLLQYNEKDLALTIAHRWIALNEKIYREDGKMMEKYNVVDTNLKAGGGNYPTQDGFGWTNGVDIFLYELINEK